MYIKVTAPRCMPSTQMPEDGMRCPGTEVTDSCELNVGPEN